MAAVSWKATSKKVAVKAKGPDGKFHTVKKTVYTCPAHPNQPRIAKNVDGKRQYVEFVEVKKKSPKGKRASPKK